MCGNLSLINFQTKKNKKDRNKKRKKETKKERKKVLLKTSDSGKVEHGNSKQLYHIFELANLI